VRENVLMFFFMFFSYQIKTCFFTFLLSHRYNCVPNHWTDRDATWHGVGLDQSHFVSDRGWGQGHPSTLRPVKDPIMAFYTLPMHDLTMAICYVLEILITWFVRYLSTSSEIKLICKKYSAKLNNIYACIRRSAFGTWLDCLLQLFNYFYLIMFS